MNRNTFGVIAVTLVIMFVLGLSGLLSSCTRVNYGEVAVVDRWGELTGEVFQPGLNWKTPIVEGVTRITSQPRVYETSSNPESTNADYPDYPVNAQTSDGQQITIKYSVIFHVPSTDEEVVSIVGSYGNMKNIVERVVKAHSRNLVRTTAQKYSADELYSGEGIFHFQEEVRNGLTLSFGAVVLDDFLVRKVEFDVDYIAAIEVQQIEKERIETAEYQSQQAVYEANRRAELAKGDAAERETLAAADANVKVINATADAEVKRIAASAEADRVMIAAQADADALKLLKDAEAYGIEQVGEMLDRYTEILTMEMVKNLDSSWVFLPSDGLLPLLPIDQLMQTIPQ